MASRIKYDAFISYRHVQPDSEIAEKLQKKLESFRIPPTVAKKVGKSRIKRVFRDESELAVAADLSEEIEKALRNSKYLICVCSPEYLESVWCIKEIETFLEISDRKHILLVLAKGEPEEAFPEILLYDEVVETGEDGKETIVRTPREPLAADCRGESTKERHAAVDKAVMRLVAAILGVGYDDLQQRHRKAENTRRTRRNLIAFGVLATVLIISLLFLYKISKQNAEIKRRYADSLAATSANLMIDGRRMDAVYAARKGLPDKKTKDYSDAASAALANALGIYDTPDMLTADEDILVPCSISSFSVSPGGSYISVRGLDYVRYVVDSTTGDVLLSFNENDFNYLHFVGDEGFVFQREEGNYLYYDFEKKTEYDLGIADGDIAAEDHGNAYAIVNSKTVDFFRGNEFVYRFDVAEVMAGRENDSGEMEVFYRTGGDEALVFFQDFELLQTYGFVVSPAEGVLYRISLGASGLISNISSDGDTLVWMESKDDTCVVYRQDLENKRGTKRAELHKEAYSTAVSGEDIVIYGSDTCLLDYDLNIVKDIGTGGMYITGVVSDDGIQLIEDVGGVYLIKDGEVTLFKTESRARDYNEIKEFRNGRLFQGYVGENHIATYTSRETEYLMPYGGESESEAFDYHRYDSPEVYNLREKALATDPDLDESNIFDVIPCTGSDYGVIQYWDRTVIIYNCTTGERIKTFYAIDGMVSFFIYDPEHHYYYISAENLEVFDENFKNIYRIPNCQLYGTDNATGSIVLARWSEESEQYFLFRPVSYEELISLADERLTGYSPDERVKEKYGLE
jgi:hypothetical protein